MNDCCLKVLRFPVYLVMAAVMLWIPGIVIRWKVLALFLFLLAIAWTVIAVQKNEVNFRSWHFVLILYVLLIFLSFAIHFLALISAGMDSYITVRGKTASDGLMYLFSASVVYSLFPVLLVVMTSWFLCDEENRPEIYLMIIPFLLIPSMMAAVYQYFLDPHFLNTPLGISCRHIPGLATDSCGFGSTLFLVFPICFLGFTCFDTSVKKTAAGLLAGLLIFCLVLNGSRSAFLGIVLFLMILPVIRSWVHEGYSGKWHSLITAMFIPLIFLGLYGFFYHKTPRIAPVRLYDRMASAVASVSQGDFNKALGSRPAIALQGLRIFGQSPFSGVGPGGFWRNIENSFFADGKKSRYFDNAANHYLQIGSELGVFGLVLNVFLHVLPLWLIFRVRKRIRDPGERWAVGIVFTTVCIFMILYLSGPHTMNIDVLWILVVMLSFLFVTAVRHGYRFPEFSRERYLMGSIAIFYIFIIPFILGTYRASFGDLGYGSLKEKPWWPFTLERNCYYEEQWDEGKIRWFGDDAVIQIPVEGKKYPETVLLKFFLGHPDIREKPVFLSVGGRSGPAGNPVAANPGWNTLKFVPFPEHFFEFHSPDGSVKKFLVLSIDVSRTWKAESRSALFKRRDFAGALLVPPLW